jgi:hypothetical protein
MKKEPAKKVVKKVKKDYLLEVVMNNETYSVETNDLNQALVDLKPEQLLSEVYVKVTKGEAVCERRLSLIEAKRVFQVEVNREVFVNNLLIVNG